MGFNFKAFDRTPAENAEFWLEMKRTMALMKSGTAYAKAGVIGEAAGAVAPEHGTLTNAALAAIQHFGDGTIPPRPFIKQPFDANQDKYLKGFYELLPKVFEKKMKFRRALTLIAAQMAKDMRQSIRSKQYEPNAPSTIAKKGSSTPLIDEGQLIRSITHVAYVPGDPPEGKNEGSVDVNE